MAMTIDERTEKDGMLKNEPALWVDSEAVMQSGRLILTSKHLLFALNEATTPAIVIDLDTINALTRETLVTDNNILAITYMQYDVAKFSVLDYDQWNTSIETARMHPHVGTANASPIQGPAQP